MSQINFSTEKKIMDLENKLVVAKGRGREWDELGAWVNGCKLLYFEWISKEILLCSTRTLSSYDGA